MDSAGTSLCFLCLWQAGSSCSVQTYGIGFSCSGVRALGTLASVVWAHGLSCSVAPAILLDQESNPCLQHWPVDSHPPYQKGSAIAYVLKMPFAGATLLKISVAGHSVHHPWNLYVVVVFLRLPLPVLHATS